MATLATEAWTGTTGAAWPAQWTTTAGGTGSSATIQSNAGRLTYPSASGYTEGTGEYLSGMTAGRDFDLTVTVTFSVITERYLYIVGRATADLFTAGYGVNVYPANGTATCGLIKLTTSGPVSLTGDLAAGAWTAGTARKVRLAAVGNSISVKVWDAGGSEPASWLTTITDTTYSAATGKVGLFGTTGNTTTGGFVTLDDLTVTDGVNPTATFTGSGTLAATGTPKPAATPAVSGSGTLAASGTAAPAVVAAVSGSGALSVTGTPKPTGTVALSGTGALVAQPGATFVATGSGALTASGRPAPSVGVTLIGSGGLLASTPTVATFGGSGNFGCFPGPVTTSVSVQFGSGGTLTADGEVFLAQWVFTGPVVYDYRPLEVTFPPTRLIVSYAYGKTVWRDAGGWHELYGPSPDDLAGADRIYPGGRLNTVGQDEAVELVAAGYGDYLTPPWTGVIPTPPPIPTPTPTPLPVAVVGSAVVGASVAGTTLPAPTPPPTPTPTPTVNAVGSALVGTATAA